MTILQILLLAVVQGAAELLPVSSSAHVIVTSKLMGLDPVSPEMTLLLVMLHTGTMFAVIVYFWKAWMANYFRSRASLVPFAQQVIAATVATAVVGLVLKQIIEKVFLRHVAHAEVELIFGNLTLIATSLAAVGVLILIAGFRTKGSDGTARLDGKSATWIGAVQGVCLPFRGFSRSGATISTGLLLGIAKTRVEEFSFALAVVLTPPVIFREVHRLWKARADATMQTHDLVALFYPSLLGMVFSFLAGLLALRWLSRWLERGRWQFFGFYCLCAAAIVFVLARRGF